MTTITARLGKLWAYNEWAWGEVWPHLQRLANEQPAAYAAERPLFWGSLHGLAAHCLAAELVWLERLHGRSPTRLPGGEDFADLAAILLDWRPLQERWREFMLALTEAQAAGTVAYHTTSGTPHSLPAVDIIQHVVNHATEHRSQMTPALYELGYATAPLDYMRFCLIT